MRKYTLYIIVGWFLVGINPIFAKPNKTVPDSLQVLRFEVNGVPFSMQRVEGGVFMMGARESNIANLYLLICLHTWWR